MSHSSAYFCDWEDTSQLTVARTFPKVGARLLRLCMSEWPVRFRKELAGVPKNPDISLVLGVRGLKRLPQFKATLASLMAQEGCPFEIVVIEQDWQQKFAELIPPGVRYIFTKSTHQEMPFNRSWALNVGVRESRGRVVVLLDADMLVPSEFAKEIATRVSGPVDGMRIPRFIFYLDEITSSQLTESLDVSVVKAANSVVQNNRTPIALTRSAYLVIGGHDEAFYGWGGEDNEFVDRAKTLNFLEATSLPLIHLWHETAPKKLGDRNRLKLDEVMRIPAAERIQMLSAKRFGASIPASEWNG